MGESVSPRGRRPFGSCLTFGFLAAVGVVAVGTGWFQIAHRLLWSYATDCGEPMDAGGRFAFSLATVFGRGAFLAVAGVLLWVLFQAVMRHPRRSLTAVGGVLVVAVLITWLYVTFMLRLIDPAMLADVKAHCRGIAAGT